MTLKIEIACDGETATFRLSGRIEQDHLAELQAEVRRYRPRLVFDLAETTLVDLAAGGLLSAAGKGGGEVVRCPRYIPGGDAPGGGQGNPRDLPRTLHPHKTFQGCS